MLVTSIVLPITEKDPSTFIVTLCAVNALLLKLHVCELRTKFSDVELFHSKPPGTVQSVDWVLKLAKPCDRFL
jgi:hypothetical protein